MAGKEKKPKITDSPTVATSTSQSSNTSSTAATNSADKTSNNKASVNNTALSSATTTTGSTPKTTKARTRRSAIATIALMDETSNASTELDSVQSVDDIEETNSSTPDSPTSKKGKPKTAEDTTKDDDTMDVETKEHNESPRSSKRKKVPITPKANKKLGLSKKALVISKRKTPLGVTRKMRGKNLRRRQPQQKRRHSTGENDVEKASEDVIMQAVPKTLRNGKPRADSPSTVSRKRVRLLSDPKISTEVTPVVTTPSSIASSKSDTGSKIETPASDSEVVVAGRRRRRSDSLSKCSDTTDTSSFCDLMQKSPSKSVENNNDTVEQHEKIPDKLKLLDKMSQNFNTETTLPDSVDTAKFVRRSTRQRRSVATPTPLPSPTVVQIKTEVKEEEIVAAVVHPLLEAQAAELLATAAATAEAEEVEPPPLVVIPDAEVVANRAPSEKSDSVSPEPTEQLAAMHVKQFYGQPVFMENNVGIESDPRVGEIITQQVVENKPVVDDVKQQNDVENTESEVVPEQEQVPEPEQTVVMVVDDEDSERLALDNSVEIVEDTTEDTPIKISDESEDVDVERLDEVSEDAGNLTFEEERPLSERLADVSNKLPVEVTATSVADAMDEVQAGVKEMLDKMTTDEQHSPTAPYEDEQPPVLMRQNEEIMEDEEKSTESKENIEPSVVDSDTNITKKTETPPPLLDIESPETLMHKESVMNALGLLTLQAADQAKLERMKKKEQRLLLQTSGRGAGYTGTLKTVIKLNRSGASSDKDKSGVRRARGPLKMTFQKGRGKQRGAAAGGGAAGDAGRGGGHGDAAGGSGSSGAGGDDRGQGRGDGMYYTIQNEASSNSSHHHHHHKHQSNPPDPDSVEDGYSSPPDDGEPRWFIVGRDHTPEPEPEPEIIVEFWNPDEACWNV